MRRNRYDVKAFGWRGNLSAEQVVFSSRFYWLAWLYSAYLGKLVGRSCGIFDSDGQGILQWVKGISVSYAPAELMDYVVTLKEGTVFEVCATNEYHAGSIVVYRGTQAGPIGKSTGVPPETRVKVHRDNIATVCKK